MMIFFNFFIVIQIIGEFNMFFNVMKFFIGLFFIFLLNKILSINWNHRIKHLRLYHDDVLMKFQAEYIRLFREQYSLNLNAEMIVIKILDNETNLPGAVRLVPVKESWCVWAFGWNGCLWSWWSKFPSVTWNFFWALFLHVRKSFGCGVLWRCNELYNDFKVFSFIQIFQDSKIPLFLHRIDRQI